MRGEIPGFGGNAFRRCSHWFPGGPRPSRAFCFWQRIAAGRLSPGSPAAPLQHRHTHGEMSATAHRARPTSPNHPEPVCAARWYQTGCIGLGPPPPRPAPSARPPWVQARVHSGRYPPRQRARESAHRCSGHTLRSAQKPAQQPHCGALDCPVKPRVSIAIQQSGKNTRLQGPSPTGAPRQPGDQTRLAD